MMFPPAAGYDRAITVFSPDGKLFQVQYAQEAVKRGLTALGIKVSSGVVLAGEKKKGKLLEEVSVEKIFEIDEHIGVAASGLIADARVLVEAARVEAQLNRLRYEEPISVAALAKYLGDIAQLYTQHGGVRPFGVRLLVGGVDVKPQLYETDPSGAVANYKAHAIGAGADTVTEALERLYREELSLDEAVVLALKVMKLAVEELSPDTLEMAVIPVETKRFRMLTKEELSKYLQQVK
ncbi:MAG: archaeal proteasome endopeptidase complex subunit alpha [Candidatus Hadarchaeales archaeon]